MPWWYVCVSSVPCWLWFALITFFCQWSQREHAAVFQLFQLPSLTVWFHFLVDDRNAGRSCQEHETKRQCIQQQQVEKDKLDLPLMFVYFYHNKWSEVLCDEVDNLYVYWRLRFEQRAILNCKHILPPFNMDAAGDLCTLALKSATLAGLFHCMIAFQVL